MQAVGCQDLRALARQVMVTIIEDTIRQEQPFPQDWLGQRVSYVYDEPIIEGVTL